MSVEPLLSSKSADLLGIKNSARMVIGPDPSKLEDGEIGSGEKTRLPFVKESGNSLIGFLLN
ncbi:MAG TPA: hypothetical protein DDW42_01030 [Desulfobacteraceae bacterium]|nr:hypothetical protein [Desulfobacteraceae bacterium]